nr:hypothetical protein [Rappaport israeli]
MSDLDWIVEARRHIGMREIVGLAHNPKILEMLRKMGGFLASIRRGGRKTRRLWKTAFPTMPSYN